MPKEIVFISGLNGSCASYFAEYILKNHPNVEVHGNVRWHSSSTINNLKQIKNKVNIYECDLLDLPSLIRILRKIRPTKIYNMAAHANVRVAFDTPLAVLNNNINCTANILEACRLECPDTCFQHCSTSEVCGTPEITPITEEHPLNPSNPYAISKLTAEKLALCYFNTWGIKTIITRAFAYINPRRYDLVATAFALQVARVEEGLQSIVYTGNLESVRTFIDVRDICEAYWIASDKCIPGRIYNIGGNEPMMVGYLLSSLKYKSFKPIPSIVNKDLLRKTDITNQIPDVNKFYKQTGWTPKYTFDESITWLLDEARKVVKNEIISSSSKY